MAHATRRPSDARVQALLDAHYARLPQGLSLPSFLDNHDLNRFLFEAKGSKARLMQAAEIQFSQDQPPIIYYGTETGMNQSRSVAGMNGDLQSRQMMPWDHLDAELVAFYTSLIRQRKQRCAAKAADLRRSALPYSARPPGRSQTDVD